MLTYLVRRLFIAAITLLLITFVVYALIRNMPGDPLALEMAEDPFRKLNERDIQLRRAHFGLDKPWPVGYAIWFGNAVQLDFGQSIPQKERVLPLIMRRIGPTLLLSATSIALAYLISIPIGLYCSAKSGRASERIISVFLYMMYSLPTYVTGLLLLYVFYYLLRETPYQLSPGMYGENYEQLSPPGKVGDVLVHMILPLICFTYGSLAYDSRFVKANMEEVLRQDYIRTARAKGADGRTILWRHAFRNTLVPFVTLLGLQLPALLSGSIIIEQIFSWPGMGRLFFESILMRDYDTIMGLTLMFSILTLAGQLMADILYAFVDPRITYN
jgi:peptide/nickel transport system permease protein